MYLTNDRDEQFVDNALFVTIVLLFAYVLKFLEVVSFDMVLVGHAVIGLYALVLKKTSGSFQVFAIIATFYFIASFGIFLNLFNNIPDYSLIKYVFQGLMLVYVLCSRGGVMNGMVNSILVLSVFFLLLWFDVFSLYTGRHYLSFLGEGFRDQYLVVSDLIAIVGLLVIAKFGLVFGIVFSAVCFGSLLFFGSRSAMVFFLVATFVHGIFIIRRGGG